MTTQHTITQVDDIKVDITRTEEKELRYVTLIQDTGRVILTKEDVRAVFELFTMNDICDDCIDIEVDHKKYEK